ncbi:GNAT family N-acetyltransferase [Dermacoccaceae bacterium W4C1]
MSCRGERNAATRNPTCRASFAATDDKRGAGVASAAVALAIRHAFSPTGLGGLGLGRLTLSAAAPNAASRAVARRNGFTEVGIEHWADLLGDGTVADAIQHELLREPD